MTQPNQSELEEQIDDLIMRLKDCISHEDRYDQPFGERCITRVQFKQQMKTLITANYTPNSEVKKLQEIHDAAKQATTSLTKELVAEARIDGAIMGAKFGNAAFRQYNVAGKPMNLDEIRDVGIKQAEDWAKRQC